MPYDATDNRYESAHYRRCGKSGLHLPEVSLGLWYNFGGVDPLENMREMLRRSFDLGIMHFDLANNYGPPPGSAETNFGRIFAEDFKPYRDELVISSKASLMPMPSQSIVLLVLPGLLLFMINMINTNTTETIWEFGIH